MSSSVSSEHIFSQGGITISKRRNRLNADIVEALQCIKCAIRHDMLFREPAPSSLLEADAVDDDEEEDNGDVDGEGSGDVDKGLIIDVDGDGDGEPQGGGNIVDSD
jgi:hypothetical protein